MTTRAGRFSTWDSFATRPMAGSPVCVVEGLAGMPDSDMARLARETGLPATAYVCAVRDRTVHARFFSTVTEMPMCGHGTIGLFLHLVETGALAPDGRFDLVLPAGTATVEMTPGDRPVVMLDARVPDFRRDPVDIARLARILGLDVAHLAPDPPPERASADFVHLIVPLAHQAALAGLDPDFAALRAFCVAAGYQTVLAFSTETRDPARTVSVRDFCPAVGVAESAAAGTSNAALSAYLLRHGLVQAGRDGRAVVTAEQGLQIDRPSLIRTVAATAPAGIGRLQVGGSAIKIAEGTLFP